MADKRIIALQRQVMIAKRALEKIAHGGRDPEGIADAALYDMLPRDKPAPMAGLMGWEKSRGGA